MGAGVNNRRANDQARQDLLASLAQRTGAQEAAANPHQFGEKRKPQRIWLWVVLAVVALLAARCATMALEPPIATAAFLELCGEKRGYEQHCMGEKADLVGEISGPGSPRELMVGKQSIELFFKKDDPTTSLVEGQRIQIKGNFGHGDILKDPEIHETRLVAVLSTPAEAAAVAAAREAKAERETLAAKCPNRPDPRLSAAAGVCTSRGGVEAIYAATSCLSELFELDRKCRAAGY